MKIKLGEFDFTVIIAMTIVVMVEMTIDNVAGVIAVWNGFVTASGAMLVTGIMRTAGVTGAATIEGMLVHMITMLVVKMTVMQIVYVVTMLYSCVSAGARMLMVVLTVCLTIAHYSLHFFAITNLVIKTVFGIIATPRCPQQQHSHFIVH